MRKSIQFGRRKILGNNAIILPITLMRTLNWEKGPGTVPDNESKEAGKLIIRLQTGF